MTTKERAGDRGRRRGIRLLGELMADGRDARVAANLTQEQIGSAIGLSDSRISAMERGDNPSVPFVVVAQYLSTVGLELSARAYPAGGGLRDAAQLGLLGRLRPLVASAFLWLGEVPMPVRGDLRAWDAGLVRDGLRIGIDAETRIRDAQALDRRVMRKLRDSGWERAIILVAATRNNRYLLREFGASLRANYPISQAEALRALAAGSDPGGNSIIAL